MKNHVTDLETSQRMKELGFPQEGEFYWSAFAGMEYQIKNKELVQQMKIMRGVQKHYSAYLLSELIEILKYQLTGLHSFPDRWRVCSYDEEGQGKTPIQATANLAIKLAEEGILQFNF